ncbi:MAG TPA: hypothetical protein VHW24_19255 [Bryobacteraceae bacterium]|jgi:hypothetical protein|nr:hypothetical protein [Bryobacteraceae bacterium]
MVFPPAVEVTARDLTAGPAAEGAAKSITCAKTDNKSDVAGAVRFACILAGGQKPIASGELAVVHFRLKQDVQGAPIRVAVEKVFATAADLKRIPISNVDAIISTR